MSNPSHMSRSPASTGRLVHSELAASPACNVPTPSRSPHTQVPALRSLLWNHLALTSGLFTPGFTLPLAGGGRCNVEQGHRERPMETSIRGGGREEAHQVHRGGKAQQGEATAGQGEVLLMPSPAGCLVGRARGRWLEGRAGVASEQLPGLLSWQSGGRGGTEQLGGPCRALRGLDPADSEEWEGCRAWASFGGEPRRCWAADVRGAGMAPRFSA